MDIIQMRRGMGRSISPLPYDAEIEWLESSGTQWIDTGVANVDDANFEIVASVHTNVDSLTIIGCAGYPAALNQSGLQRVMVYKSRIIVQRSQYSETGVINIPFDTARHKYILTKQNAFIDDSVATISLPYSGSYDASNTFVLYATRLNDRVVLTNGIIRIYSCKIYNNALLVRDFIPVRVGQVGYMYDKVSGQLFGNAGTGSFILGPDK